MGYYCPILRRIKPNSRVVPATRMGHPPSCFRSGCWAVCYRSIYWVYYYQRESEAGAEGQATGGMTPQFASTVFHVQYSRLLLNKQLRPSPTRIVYARTRHLNAYILTVKRPLGNPYCTCSRNRLNPASRKTFFQYKSDRVTLESSSSK